LDRTLEWPWTGVPTGPKKGPWTITGVVHGPGIHVLYTSGKKASGWVTGESEGTPEVLLTKARSGIPDSGIP